MFRQIDLAVQALKGFIKLRHCRGDRCAIGTFNDGLSWITKLELEEAAVAKAADCLDDVETHGGTRLYDSLCDAVNHLHKHGDSSRPWYIFALTYNNDDKSICSAEECKRYIFTKYMRDNSHIFVISVGKDVDCAKLDNIQISKCLYHVHIKSSSRLHDYLVFQLCFSDIVHSRTSADFVVLCNNSASMGVLKGRPASSNTTSGTTAVLSCAQPPLSPDSQSDAQAPLTEAKCSPQVPTELGPPVQLAPQTSRVRIRMREFINKDLHPSDRQIFREFAVKNYPNIPNKWEEENIEFLVLVESRGRSIVGLLVMLPYDAPASKLCAGFEQKHRVHIRLMVVDKEYRKHGLGTKMLAYVAGKYYNSNVTLNVAFDRLDLLNFYYDKGYVKFEEFSTEHKVIVFSLVHLELLAEMPLPE